MSDNMDWSAMVLSTPRRATQSSVDPRLYQLVSARAVHVISVLLDFSCVVKAELKRTSISILKTVQLEPSPGQVMSTGVKIRSRSYDEGSGSLK